MKNQTKLALLATLAGCVGGNIMAGNITNYTTGDVLLCFNAGGQYNLVVDAGPIATLTGLAPNQRYAIGTYNATTQLGNYISSDFSGISWSAFTWLNDDTLYMTEARTSLNSETDPWLASSTLSQANVAARLQKIQQGAAGNITFKSANSSSAVVEPSASKSSANYRSGGLSYYDSLTGSYGGNFNGTFQGSPENTTLSSFATDGLVVRSDFYQLSPTSGYAKGTLLGYFEFAPDGSTTYVAYPTTTPALVSLKRVGTTNTISYTTGTYGTYTLRGTSSAGLTAPATTWPVISTLNHGDTLTHSITDVTTDNNRFYIITAQ